MKTKKLKLRDLEVSSFVTTKTEETKTIKGGAFTDFASLIPGAGTVCLVGGTMQATAGITEITGTVVRSQQQMDCPGATRLIAGCTNGTFPCNANCP